MPLFTPETAAIAGQRGALARWSRPRPQTIPDPQPPAPAIMAGDDFTRRKLLRVRAQIQRVEDLLTAADEPQAVDRFAAALARLYEIERILAGRPLPGSRRPREERAPRAEAGAWTAEPLDVQAQVQAPAYSSMPAPIDQPSPIPDPTPTQAQPLRLPSDVTP